MMRLSRSATIALLVITGTALAREPYVLEPAPQVHSETIEAGRETYTVRMGGALDGFNTVLYRETYGGHMRQEPAFEPNQYLMMENMGDADVVNPRIVVNGRRDWFSAGAILDSILEPGMTDADKAMAVFRFTSDIALQAHDNNRRVGPPFPGEGSELVNGEQSHPSRNTFQERANPVKAANSYYCSGCSLSAANFVVLCRHAGLIARAVWMSPLNTYKTHCVGEAWYGGGWHLFDPERRSFYLERDNQTIASYEDLHNDPELAERTHDGGFSAAELKSHAPDYAAFYPPHIMPVEQWLSTMAVTLRPGETFIWRWDHIGKYRYGANVRKKSGQLPYHLANGKLIYRPRLDGEAYLRGIMADHNLVSAPGPGGQAVLHPLAVSAPGIDGATLEGPPGHVIWKVESPYPIVGGLVGGRFRFKGQGTSCRVFVSVHDGDWAEVWSTEAAGELEGYGEIDALIDPLNTPAVYAYYVKFEVQTLGAPEDACIVAPYIETDIQMAATALPALSVGPNKVAYSDESPSARQVRITHGWTERADNAPPEAPAPVKANEGGLLQWKPAVDPDGGGVATYHVQVSPCPDMRHPVSPNLDRLTSNAETAWPIPEGWLIAGQTYYWRVRAQDDRGAWSDWSRTAKYVAAR